MRTKFGLGLAAGTSLAILGLVAAIGALAADAPPGERWHQTQSMEMMGMSMPGRSSDFCKAPGTDDLPVQPDKDCRMYDVRRTPQGATFKMSCTGEHAAEADGETTYLGPNHTRTKMHMKMAEGEVTMNVESEKVGACTGNEANLVVKREVAKAQAMGAKVEAEARQQLAKTCADAARTAESPALMTRTCTDPATIKTYCSNFQAHEPFRKQAEEEARNRRSGSAVPSGLEWQLLPLTTTARMCGIDTNKLRERLCGTAEAKGQMAFIATQCPALAKVIEAARERCAGRGYTSMPANYREVCGSVAAAAANAGDAGSGAPAQVSRVCVDAARTADSPDLMTQECKDPATLATYCANFQTPDAFRKQAEKEARLVKAGTPANDRTRPLSTSLNLCGLERDAVIAQLCAKARELGDSAFVSSQCANVAAAEKKPSALSKGKKMLGGLLGN